MAAEEKEEEALLNLFDSYWFGHEILSQKSPSQPQQATNNPTLQVDESAQEETLELPILNLRSLSDQFLNTPSFSPSGTPKLQTIFSGEQVTNFSKNDELPAHPTKSSRVSSSSSGSSSSSSSSSRRSSERKRRKRVLGPSKSLSELEFEELKGFMDLGFVFTEEDKDSSRLVSIIPGLQRLASCEEEDIRDYQKEEEEEEDHGVVSRRPYLSEAWDVLDQRKKENQMLMKWRIPAATNLGKDMKHHLRFWAHSVASSVR
ncbi:hypothetical protein FF1_046824 [Malus domestica]